MKVPFNRDVLAERMNSLGLTERALTSRTGMAHVSFRMARLDGQLPRHTPLTQIHKLADELGVRVVDLLTVDEAPAEPIEPTEQSAADDAATLIPLLISVPRQVNVQYLGRVLDWEAARLESALDAAAFALQGTGLRLHRPRDVIRLVPINRTDKDIRARLANYQTKSGGLTRGYADTLHRIYDGSHNTGRNIGNQERLTIGALKNMGCIELGDKGAWQPTADFLAAFP